MKINIKENKYNFKIEDLMVIEKRANNPKRNFLFVSKLLGKHIEVNPDICKATGKLLTLSLYGRNPKSDVLENLIKGSSINKDELYKELNHSINSEDNTFVLGFSETATGLGMAVAASIKNSHYQTTTREDITGISNMLSFEEEHSHATGHKCFSTNKYKLELADRVILVDDEVTTGNSMQNLIKELSKITSVKKYSILTILDWRNEERIESMNSLAQELEIEINVVSIMSGDFVSEDKTVYCDVEGLLIEDTVKSNPLNVLDRVDIDTSYGKESYFENSGRFGVDFEDINLLEKQCKRVAFNLNNKLSDSDDILVLGHGEDIYIPSRVASYLKGNVKFRTTTRSPIYCDGDNSSIIKTKHTFIDRGTTYYLYNREKIEKKYDKVILLTETDLNVRLTNNLTIYKI